MKKEMSREEVTGVLNANKTLNFVKRILNPKKKLDNENGTFSTHTMTWLYSFSNGVGEYVVFPTVIEEDGILKRLGADDVWDHALSKKEYIVFDSKDEAVAFSKDYKKYKK